MGDINLRSSYDSNHEFLPGSRAIYEENGAKTEVTVLENRCTPNHEIYLLRLDSVKVPGVGLRKEDIGEIWEYSVSRSGGGSSCGTLTAFEDRHRVF